MKVWLRAATVVIFLAMAVSCRQLYTSSLGSSLKRDSISIPASTSVSDLVDMASSSDATDPDVAKELLGVLAGKDQADLLALNATDKESILNLATSAAVDMPTLSNLAKDATQTGADKNKLISNALSSFDTSVDLTAVETLLGDTATVKTAPVESVVLAATAVLADASAAVGSGTVMDVLAGKTAISTLPAEQQAQLQLVIDVRTTLNTRSDTNTEVAGFNLNDLLKGTQS